MKKVVPGLLAAIVVLGLFAAAGYAGYRFGYAQGVQTTVKGTTPRPELRPFDDASPRGMPMHRFGFERGPGRGGFPMMGFGFFGPWMFLGHLIVFALIIWFIYWLFTRSGWRLTRQPEETRQPAESSPAKTENE